MQKKAIDTSDREIRITRLLDAPLELVWEMWTNAAHIKNWWGPKGFTNTILKMDLRDGGEWDLIMHGPDGTDYKNKSIFIEVSECKKIVYDHNSGPKFKSTIEFNIEGYKTNMDWLMLFGTKEECEQVVKIFKADEGLRQNVDKLEEYILSLKTKIIN